MADNSPSFLDLPLTARIRRVVRNSLGLSILGAPLYVDAIFGGRFQRSHGTVSDIWLLALLYPLGLISSALVAATLSRLFENRWSATVAVGASALPLFALLSLAIGHSGPAAPYRVDWPLTLGCSGMFAAITPLFYGYWVRRVAEIQQRMRRDREAAR